MQEYCNTDTLDIRSLKWGKAPIPLVPSPLRKLWGGEPLPAWLIAEAGLPANSTIDSLGPSFWKWQSHVSPRLQHFVEFLIKSRVKSIESVFLLEQPWPVGLEIADVPFSPRATNALRASGLLAGRNSLADITFGELLRLPSLGTKSLLEIATLAEAALHLHWRVTTELAKSFAGLSEQEVDAMQSDHETSDLASNSAGTITGDWRESLTAVLQEPWIDQIDEYDPLFRGLFPPGYGTLEDRIERAISDPASSSAEIPALVKSLPRIREAVARMAAKPLEESLMDLLEIYVGRDEPRLSGIAARLGWQGEDPKTLQECGDLIGVTRERVRQIEAKLLRKLTNRAIYLPKLDDALVALEGAAPSPISSAADLLVREGICQRPFSPQSVIRTAKLFGRKTNLAVETHGGERVLVSGDQGWAIGALSRIARKLAGQSGVSSVYKVVDEIIEILNLVDAPDISEEDVRRILRGQGGCEFLDDDWFWFTGIPEGRNRLVNIAKKILSVASPQPMAGLREGIRRVYRWRASSNRRYRGLTVPPQAVLARFLQSHPDFQVIEDLVTTSKPLDYRKLLGDGEQTIVDVLRGVSSGVLDRRTLVSECLARGINENTLAVYTSYSPILEHIGTGLWQLRGVRVDPSAIEAVRQQNALRPREKRLRDFGWSADGTLWVAWTLPTSTGSPVLGIPSAIKRYLCNRAFEVQAKDLRRPLGKISINDDGASYGYSPFFRYSGVDEGDTLKAEFDLPQSTVRLAVNEEVFEDEE